jgi:hypothetical protein
MSDATTMRNLRVAWGQDQRDLVNRLRAENARLEVRMETMRQELEELRAMLRRERAT